MSHFNTIARSQIFPFYFFEPLLRRRYGVHFQEILVDRLLEQPARADLRADIILVQPWFRLGNERIVELLDRIRHRSRPERMVFLDCHAPTDLRFASAVDPFIDLYVKKHLLRDRAAYLRPTLGDTNLTDYCARRYGLALPPTHFPIPPGFFEKLLVGPSFQTADYLLPRFLERPPAACPRPIDLHARLGTGRADFYADFRREAVQALAPISGLTAVTGSGVPKGQYLRELSRSKICWSPFGYGEVAWRDYEAFAYGSLLLKPNMSHIETDPDLFVTEETYVPVAWDFSDLAPRLGHYLTHDEERRAIARTAFSRLHRWADEAAFVPQMERVFAG